VDKPNESYKRLIKNIKGSNFLENLINKYYKGENNLSNIRRKSVINPIINNSFEKLNENFSKKFKRQKSVNIGLIKNNDLGNKLNSFHPLNIFNNLLTPQINNKIYEEEDSEKKNDNLSQIIHNKISENNKEDNFKIEKTNFIINNNNNNENKKSVNNNENNDKNEYNYNINNIINNNISNNYNNNNYDYNITEIQKTSPKTINIVNHNKIEHFVDLSSEAFKKFNPTNKTILRNKDSDKRYYIRHNVKFANSITNSPDKKVFNSDNINDSYGKSLIQSKSYSVFPTIYKNGRKELLSEENDEKKILKGTTNSARNYRTNKNESKNLIYNQKYLKIANTTKEKNKLFKNKNENLVKTIKQNNDSYTKNINNQVNENNDFQNKNIGIVDSNNSILNKSFLEKNDNNLNINKTQNVLKNKFFSSNSHEKDFSDNYYYNLMVNEDINRKSELKNSPKIFYGNFKKNN
jgi:hypothetical protein